MTKRIGVLSDTHGLLRDEVKARLQGCELIVHAGDLGREGVLRELRRIADLVAVRGNVDRGGWAMDLRQIESFEVEDRRVCVVHDIGTVDPRACGADLLIYGHSHEPTCEEKDGILYLNPGSAGPRRFHLPISMALLEVAGAEVHVDFITL